MSSVKKQKRNHRKFKRFQTFLVRCVFFFSPTSTPSPPKPRHLLQNTMTINCPRKKNGVGSACFGYKRPSSSRRTRSGSASQSHRDYVAEQQRMMNQIMMAQQQQRSAPPLPPVPPPAPVAHFVAPRNPSGYSASMANRNVSTAVRMRSETAKLVHNP